MNCIYQKTLRLLVLTLVFVFISAFTGEFTTKDEPLPNMPKGNPDPNLGIVIHPNSTGVDVLRDSSQNIRFVAFKDLDDTNIETLRSSSMVDHTPKKFKFVDKQHGIASDKTYEFSIHFDDDNHQWESIRFMPFPSVIEWVTEEKLLLYAKQWAKTFEDAGWKRTEYPDSDDPRRVQNFKVPTLAYAILRQYCLWTTKDYKAVMRVSLRDRNDYLYYLPKEQRGKIKEYPDGYIAFITITKNSQFDL